MDAWAQEYFGRATFICVGCDGPDLARAFTMRLQLSKCLVTYVDHANGPKWGQLGCNGFIVLDSNGKVACGATSAYLDVKEHAFAHVESVLEPLLSGATQPPQPAKPEAVEPFDRITGGCAQPEACDAEEEMPKRMKRAAAKASQPSSVSEVTPLCAIDSVRVASLDAEHELCTAALGRMAEAPNRENIERVIEAYATHFAHEEAMLDEHVYAAADGADGGFSAEASARRSHFADHKRMLGDLRARAAALPSGGPASGPKAWIHTTSGGESAAAFVDRVLRAFEHHANVYDAAYAEPLASRLGEMAAVAVQ